ncbi:MAG TPA: substrate-binding domain-containing protein [Bacillota bacterium]|nr:substrate-binding domain-containing protein [Bacillota bacterium]
MVIAGLLLANVFPVMAGTTPAKPKLVLQPEITLATTTSTQDSGLLDVLLPAFYKKTKVKVKVIAVGTGQAIELGKKGDADVLLVHARKSEDQFMKDGYGYKAWDVMYNQFYIVGPASDPAHISGVTKAADAFKKIAASGAKFVSRGDNSGTHTKEKSIWDKAGVKPEGSWYISAGQGMGETLTMAGEMGAYTITDEATFLTNKTGLKVLVKGDSVLFNPYGIIEVKGNKRHASVNEFIWFMISPQGQKLIGDYGKAKYKKGLFVPNAKKRPAVK